MSKNTCCYDQSSMAAWIADMRSKPNARENGHGPKSLRRSEAYRIFKKAVAIARSNNVPFTNRMSPPRGKWNGKENPTGSDIRFDYWMNYYQFEAGTYQPVVTWRTRNPPQGVEIRPAPVKPKTLPATLGRPRGERFDVVPEYQPDHQKRWIQAIKRCRAHKRLYCLIPTKPKELKRFSGWYPLGAEVVKAKSAAEIKATREFCEVIDMDYRAMRDPLVKQRRSGVFPFADEGALALYGVPEEQYLSTIAIFS